MFNKAKDDTTATPVTPDPIAPAVQPAPPQRQRMAGASTLGADLVITGTVYSEGEIQLHGAVEGDVRAGSLTLGENASIKGEVEADTAVIHGHLAGSLRAREVRLAAGSRVEGDIIHSTLSIEAGAFFEGQCRRADDPLSEKSRPGANAQVKKPAAAYYGNAAGTAPAAAAPADKVLNAE